MLQSSLNKRSSCQSITEMCIFTADYIKAKDMYQVSKMDDLWFESVLNEPETFRNGVAVLMDVKGYVYN